MCGWNGYRRLGSKRTESAFVLLRVRLNLNVLLMRYEVVASPLLHVVQLYILQRHWQLCVDLRLLNVRLERVLCWAGTGVVLALNEQRVRLYCCVCA